MGEESWGMGRINKIYPYTDWRPTRVFWSDNIWEQTQADVLAHLAQGYDFYCRPNVIDEFTGAYVPREKGRDGATWQTDIVFDERPDQVHTYDYCTEHNHRRPDPAGWRDDVAEGVYCKFGGTFQVALMHGVEEGFNPIYVVGADLGITPGGMLETRNHFLPDYQVMEYDQRKADGKNRAYALAHSLAKTYAKERGIEILNAGIGGHLEAYKRVDFASLFGG
jgi:hypothetical protein